MSNSDRIKLICEKSAQRVFSAVTHIEKKVLFSSFLAKKYSDNPRAISEKMHELYPDYKLVWAINDTEAAKEAPDYVKVVKTTSLSYYKELASSFCVVNNEAFTQAFCKRKGQFYIQTWHGDRGIKRILYDSLDKRGITTDKYIDGAVTDVFVVGSEYAIDRIPISFHYNGEVENSGCPRNDGLVISDPEAEREIRKRIEVSEDAKILLYAPTLRRNKKVVDATVDLKKIMELLRLKGENWVCLVRAHPKSLGLNISEDVKDIIDVSKYQDMADLLRISDMLITDYSSSAGDFVLTDKAVILAQFDLEQFKEEGRTFFADIDEIGYIITHSQEELNNVISTYSDEDYKKSCEKVKSFFRVHETGKSSQIICDRIDKEYKQFKESR